MSDAIDVRDYERAIGEAIQRKEQLRRVKAENEAMRVRIAETEKERDDALTGLEAMKIEAKQWQDKFASSPDEWRAKYEDAQKQIKQRDLRSLFDKHVGKYVGENAAASAWDLAKLTPDDAGDLDDEAMSNRIVDLVKAHPILAKPDPAVSGSRGADASGRPHANQSQPGPGAVRGSVNTPHATGSTTGGAAQAAAYLEKTGRSSTPYRIA